MGATARLPGEALCRWVDPACCTVVAVQVAFSLRIENCGDALGLTAPTWFWPFLSIFSRQMCSRRVEFCDDFVQVVQLDTVVGPDVSFRSSTFSSDWC